MSIQNNNTERGLSRVIAQEPVITSAVSALVVGVVNLLVEFGVNLTEGQTLAINAVALAVMGLIFVIARQFSTSNAEVKENYTEDADVVETIIDGEIVAGPANELKTGEYIRQVGESAS